MNRQTSIVAVITAALGLAFLTAPAIAGPESKTTKNGAFRYEANKDRKDHVEKIIVAAEKTATKASDKTLWSFKCDGDVLCIALSADESRVAVATPKSLYVLESRTGKQLDKQALSQKIVELTFTNNKALVGKDKDKKEHKWALDN